MCKRRDAKWEGMLSSGAAAPGSRQKPFVQNGFSVEPLHLKWKKIIAGTWCYGYGVVTKLVVGPPPLGEVTSGAGAVLSNRQPRQSGSPGQVGRYPPIGFVCTVFIAGRAARQDSSLYALRQINDQDAETGNRGRRWLCRIP